MAPESCNLGKDEAEILKTSSASPSPSSSPQNPAPQAQPAAQLPPSCLLLKPSLDFFAQKSEMVEIEVKAPSSSLPKPEEKSRPPVLFGHRCSTCRKRLGLTGFRCRCGELFCARHRYSDRHVCSFDYKAAGREEISKANPLIRAAKIIKI